MSAVAFAITKPKIVLLSDGMATKDGEVYDMNSSKIHKFSDRVAILWMGVGAHALADILKQQVQAGGLTEPEEIAKAAGQVLKSGYKDGGKEHMLESKQFWVTTIGYDKEGNPVAYQLDPTEDYRYEPKQSPITPGQVGSMVNEFEYNHHFQSSWPQSIYPYIKI